MKNLERMRNIVSSMTKEEVTKEISNLEQSLFIENIVIKYSLDNDIKLGSYLYKTNALSDTLSSFRLVAHEQGKLEDKLYA